MKRYSEKTKWAHFWEICSRKYVWIPALLIAMALLEMPPITARAILKFFQSLL